MMPNALHACPKQPNGYIWQLPKGSYIPLCGTTGLQAGQRDEFSHTGSHGLRTSSWMCFISWVTWPDGDTIIAAENAPQLTLLWAAFGAMTCRKHQERCALLTNKWCQKHYSQPHNVSRAPRQLSLFYNGHASRMSDFQHTTTVTRMATMAYLMTPPAPRHAAITRQKLATCPQVQNHCEHPEGANVAPRVACFSWENVQTYIMLLNMCWYTFQPYLNPAECIPETCLW